jgi:glycosyltransferase involved in cell wall biosynthesis
VKRVAILHYASPPTVGGVESTIAYHARELTRLGYSVRVVSGSGATFDDQVETHINPLFGSTHPDVLRVKAQLDNGQVTGEFYRLSRQIVEHLYLALTGCDVCIAHNVLTLNKNLALTKALVALNREKVIHVIGWCHDLAWTNPQYQPELHKGNPWSFLKRPWPGAHYVTVSEPRRAELADLLGIDPESIEVVVPGVEPASFFHWTPTMVNLESRLCLLDADGLLLVPARLTRRKNIALALRILAAIREKSGRDFRLIVTGPPGPHNPTNPGYLGELLSLCEELDLTESAHFLYAYGEDGQPLIPDDATMANLYQLSDALLFPSIQEGFGIPILEAGLAALPIFCADIPPLKMTGQNEVTYFNPRAESSAEIGKTASMILKKLDANPTYRLRVRVRQKYRWQTLVRERLVPMLESVETVEPTESVDGR